jgi:hypothetical protein
VADKGKRGHGVPFGQKPLPDLLEHRAPFGQFGIGLTAKSLAEYGRAIQYSQKPQM